MDITNFILSHRERALLIGDYGTYRSQLSRQLVTLRKRLGRSTPKKAKFTAKPITVEDFKSNNEVAHIILLTAERAWAHAMHMKSSHAEDSASQKFPGSTRSHIVSRLIKASKEAETLVEILRQISQDGESQVDFLEAQAYSTYLAGLAEFEKHSASPKLGDVKAQREMWQECLENLAVARVIYGALLKRTKKDYFKEILTGSVDATIRFAAYQSEIPRTIAISEVARRYFPANDSELVKAVEAQDSTALQEADKTNSKEGGLPTSISWRSRKANIVDASIGQALVAVAAAEGRLIDALSSKSVELSTTSRAAAYDEVLNASQDAVDATRHAIEDHEKEKIAESDPRMQDLRVTSLAVSYDMIGWRVGRNRALIGSHDGLDFEFGHKQSKGNASGKSRKLAKLRERVVLLDAILQSIESIKELRGAARDSGFIAELEAKRAYFQALKCVNIAQSHILISGNKNALALLLRAQTLIGEAHDTLSSKNQRSKSEPLKLDVHKDLLDAASSTIQSRVYQYQGLVELQILNEKPAPGKTGSGNSVPVIERLDEYSAGGIDLSNLVIYPPKLQPVPVKPLFFDLAWNYIDYPGRLPPASVDDKLSDKSQATADDKKSGKRGWFGFGIS